MRIVNPSLKEPVNGIGRLANKFIIDIPFFRLAISGRPMGNKKGTPILSFKAF